MTNAPEQNQDQAGSMSNAPSTEGSDRPEGRRPDLSARDLQTNAGQDTLETRPGSDADQANEVPHVG